MSRLIIVPFAIIAIPFIIAYMWIRHPVMCWREMRNSWLLVFRGKDVE